MPGRRTAGAGADEHTRPEPDPGRDSHRRRHVGPEPHGTGDSPRHRHRQPDPVTVTAERFVLGVVSVVTAVLLQVTVIGRLPLPGAEPDLVLVLVVAFAFAEGPMSGLATGWSAGLLADALSDHQLGRLALAYAVAGYVTGMVQDSSERSTLQPFVAVALGAVTALACFVGVGILLGDPRVTLYATFRSLVSSVPYDVVLTPFVVPLVGGLARRLDRDSLRRL